MCVRVRPMDIVSATTPDAAVAWTVPEDEHGTVVLADGSKGRSFSGFDRVYGGAVPTSAMFAEIGRSLVRSVLEGYNSTIFAYGQTAAGKTFTMQGEFKKGKFFNDFDVLSCRLLLFAHAHRYYRQSRNHSISRTGNHGRNISGRNMLAR